MQSDPAPCCSQRHQVKKGDLIHPTIPRCCPSPKHIDRPRTIRPVSLPPNLIQSRDLEFTFRISLFRTLHFCWMSAALCETFSRELPLSCSSSFTFFDTSTSTPGCITTLRTIFSPMKFLVNPSALALTFPSCLVLHCHTPAQTFTYRISTSHKPVSLFLSKFTLMGKWA
jgi:hypothetical protein